MPPIKRKRQDNAYKPYGGRPYKSSRSVVTYAPRSGGLYSRMEKKTIDVDPNTIEITTTPSITLLNGVATGSDFTDRVGRKINLHSWSIRGFLSPTDSLVDTANIRMMVVLDLQTNGAAPAITDILKSSSPSAQLNLNNRDCFRVLMDKMIVSGPLTAAFVGTPITTPIKKYRKIRQEMIFTGTLSTVASISSGAIWLVMLGNNSAGAGRNFVWSSRVRFTDS